MNKKTVKRGLMPYLFIAFVMLGVMYFVNFANTKVNFLTYDEFMGEVEKGNVEEVYLTPRSRASVYEITGSLKSYEKGESFFFRLPLAEESIEKIIEASDAKKFSLDTSADPEASMLLQFLVNIFPMILLIGFQPLNFFNI